MLLLASTSYLGIMSEHSLDLKLIPQYDGSGTASVVEWIEKLELVCKLRKIDDVASVIPLRLSGGAFAVYLQLGEEEKKKKEKIKEALLAAFAADPYAAYEQFVSRKLTPGESPDVFLAELRRLSSLFGGMSEKGLACAFVSGLPESVRQLLRAGSRMEALDIGQLLTRARAVIRDDGTSGIQEACLAAQGDGKQISASNQRCYICDGVNHFARNCLARRGEAGTNRGLSQRRRVRCYRCGVWGHVSSACSGNASGGEASAPVSPQKD